MPSCWRRQACAQMAPLLNFSDRRALSRLWRRSGRAGRASPATTRSPGAMPAPPIALGVDIIQNCEVTGFIVEGGRCAGVETTQGRDPRRRRRARGRRPFQRARRQGRLPSADQLLFAAGDGVASRSSRCLDTVVLSLGTGTYLLPVRQGRDRVRRRARPRALLRPARQSADAADSRFRPARDVPDLRPAEDAAAMGRRGRCRAGFLADHRPLAAARPLSQLRLGHRRLQVDPRRRLCCWRTSSPPARTTRSAGRSTSTASRPAALVDEAAGSGIAH